MNINLNQAEAVIMWIFRANCATVSQQTVPFLSRQTEPVRFSIVKIYHCYHSSLKFGMGAD
jgi:hypothetical protein